MENLTSRVIKTENINWRDFKFIQSDSFKDFELEAAHKLKASILGNNFTQPFYVWNYPSGNSLSNPDRDQLKNHPTPKPVVMLADAILGTTNENDIVIDFFCGSGSTLIACEKTKRRCISTEIEPTYVQSIVNRYLIYCSKNGIAPVFEHTNGSLTINDFKNGNN